jgi:iron complex outermembrane recepter protein
MNKPTPQKTLIAASLCLAMSSTLHAQTLEDVVVSASRSEQSSFDAPGSIQSVDRTVIESAGPQINISEALAGVPGINVANRNNYSQDLQISIRGFGSRAPFGVRGVRLLIDGIPQTLPDGQGQSSQFALTSADRIEVLKGPIAMLYGNAAGGVVQVFTRSAGGKPEFSVTGYVGSDDLFRTTTQYSEKRGNYGLVLDYATFRTDGFRDYSKAERNHLNAKLEYQGEKGKTTFIANVVDNKTQEPGSLTKSSYDEDREQALTFNRNNLFGKEFTQSIYGIASDYKLSPEQSISYRAYFGNRDLDNPSPAGYSMIDRVFYGVGASITTRSQINQIPLSTIFGIDADYVKDKRTAEGNDIGKPNGIQSRDEDNVAYNTDFFMQSQLYFNDQYTGLLGVRIAKVRLIVKDNFGDLVNGSGARTYQGVSPVIGLTRHVSQALNIFAQAGRGFETPTLTEILYARPLLTNVENSSGTNKFNTEIDAARSQQLELGFKWRPDNTTKIDGSIFYVTTKNDLVPDSINASGSTWQNAKTQRQGLELSALKLIAQTLAINAAYTFFDAKYLSDGGLNSAQVQSGKIMPGVPRHKFFGELAWRSVGWATKPTQSFTEAGLEINAVGEMYTNSKNSDYPSMAGSKKTSAYETINLRASRHIKNGNQTLSFYGRIDNLTDKEYVGSVVVDQSSGRYFEPGAPRNWLIGAKYTLTM